jgi:hypothetical protein
MIIQQLASQEHWQRAGNTGNQKPGNTIAAPPGHDGLVPIKLQLKPASAQPRISA